MASYKLASMTPQLFFMLYYLIAASFSNNCLNILLSNNLNLFLYMKNILSLEIQENIIVFDFLLILVLIFSSNSTYVPVPRKIKVKKEKVSDADL